ncbi:ADP-ribosylation factor-binding protein GGA3a isoform X2 [Mastacembelus armatus]|nr:ADP-ribosylation factor-binding protein GGA3-like isoform X2 [Mastacembelus armatus]
MQALMVLEACMKNCGQRFHSEVGKFKFLNELIKVISPKYFGDKVSEKVKTKVIEMLYSWTLSLPDEAKICEAYRMLKSQGIVLADPQIPFDVSLTPSPSPRPKNPVFDDEKKSKRLAELLKSKKSEDLQEANHLIKNMVKEDEVRTQKAAKQKSTLEAVRNSVKVLNDMLAHFSPEDSTDGDKELIRELYGDCDKLRQTVFQLATEAEDNDSTLGDILQANDDLCHAINLYRKIVEGQTIEGESKVTQQIRSSVRQGTDHTNQSEILIDLVGLDVQNPVPSAQQPPAPSLFFPNGLLSGSAAIDPQSPSPSAPSAACSLLDKELLSLGLSEPFPVPSKSTVTTHANLNNNLPFSQDSSQDLGLLDTASTSGPTFSTSLVFPEGPCATVIPVTSTVSWTTASAMSFSCPAFSIPALSTESRSAKPVLLPQPVSSVLTTSTPAVVSRSFNMAVAAPSATLVTPQQVSTSPGDYQSPSASLSHNLQDLALLDLGSPKKNGVLSTTSTSLLIGGALGGPAPSPVRSQEVDNPLLHSLSPILHVSQASPYGGQEVSLASVSVPLDSIRPSKVCPVTAYDKNGVRLLLHFATDCPPGRPDVLVIVASMLNTAPQPVRSLVLQAAVPKTMKVKLQPPSGTELAPFNPVLPPAAITQVMLLANPLKEKVRMRYKLTFTLGEQPFTEVGEVHEFPPADRWGAL